VAREAPAAAGELAAGAAPERAGARVVRGREGALADREPEERRPVGLPGVTEAAGLLAQAARPEMAEPPGQVVRPVVEGRSVQAAPQEALAAAEARAPAAMLAAQAGHKVVMAERPAPGERPALVVQGESSRAPAHRAVPGRCASLTRKSEAPFLPARTTPAQDKRCPAIALLRRSVPLKDSDSATSRVTGRSTA